MGPAGSRAPAASAPLAPANTAATSAPVTLPRWAAALGTAVFALIVQGAGVLLLPYAFTHWQPGAPSWPVVIRVIGVIMIATGGIVVAWAFTQFAAEGVGVPIPGEPNSQRLTVGGPYRYVRNPLYVASVTPSAGRPAAQQGRAAYLRSRVPRHNLLPRPLDRGPRSCPPLRPAI